MIVTHNHVMERMSSTDLFMKVAYPFSKLSGIGDGRGEEDVMDVIREKDDRLLPYHTTLWEQGIP